MSTPQQPGFDGRDPQVSSSGSFDFDAQRAADRGASDNYDARSGGGPGGGQGGGPGGGPGGPGGGSGRRLPRWVPLLIGAVVIILIFVGCSALSRSASSNGARDCGDYSLQNGTYVSTPNAGDYDQQGDSYVFVGCRTTGSSSGGVGFFPFFLGGIGGGSGGSGGNDGGSGNRGGGTGSGK